MVGTAHLAQKIDNGSDLVVASAVAVSTGPAASATAVAEATTPAGAILSGTSKVDGEGTSTEVFPVEHRNGALSFLRGGHLNKAKAL